MTHFSYQRIQFVQTNAKVVKASVGLDSMSFMIPLTRRISVIERKYSFRVVVVVVVVVVIGVFQLYLVLFLCVSC